MKDPLLSKGGPHFLRVSNSRKLENFALLAIRGFNRRQPTESPPRQLLANLDWRLEAATCADFFPACVREARRRAARTQLTPLDTPSSCDRSAEHFLSFFEGAILTVCLKQQFYAHSARGPGARVVCGKWTRPCEVHFFPISNEYFCPSR